MTGSPFDKRNSFLKGKQGESNFITVAEKLGKAVRDGTPREDIDEHIDKRVEWDKDGEWKTVDVKSRKSLKRGEEPQDEWILLEDRNVQGKKGWMHGSADYIAFEQLDCFILAPRTGLEELWEKLIDKTKMASSAKTAKYCVYTRPNRFDVFGLVKNTDVKAIAGTIIWEK